MNIITLSEPDCGGKPTAYAAILESLGSIEIASHVRSALEENWRYGNDAASSIASDPEMMSNLRSSGFCWIRERILVEITEVDKFPDEQEKKRDAEVFMICFNGGMIRIDSGKGPYRSDRNYYERVVRDAMRFYLL